MNFCIKCYLCESNHTLYDKFICTSENVHFEEVEKVKNCTAASEVDFSGEEAQFKHFCKHCTLTRLNVHYNHKI